MISLGFLEASMISQYWCVPCNKDILCYLQQDADMKTSLVQETDMVGVYQFLSFIDNEYMIE
jgi:hypothetical protein